MWICLGAIALSVLVIAFVLSNRYIYDRGGLLVVLFGDGANIREWTPRQRMTALIIIGAVFALCVLISLTNQLITALTS